MPERALSVREAVFAESESAPVKNALGRVAASLVLPCPPCIALSAPGEIINEEIQGLFVKYGIERINLVK